MSNSKVLVAGATGTNGRALIDTLIARDTPVRALVRNIESARATLPDGIELVQGDLGAPDSLNAAFDGVDKAYVVTAVQPETVALLRNFFSAAQAAGVTHMVKLSGMGASNASPSEVIRQHAATDEDLHASGLPYTILRPNSFHQNMLWQAGGIASTGNFYLPLGDAAQSTIDVRDIAEITSTILTTDGHIGKTYDLTGPESLTFHEVARIIAEVRRAPVEYASPKRSFNRDILGQIQTVLSLRDAGTNERRDLAAVRSDGWNVCYEIGNSEVAFSVETTMEVRNFRTFLSAKKN